MMGIKFRMWKKPPKKHSLCVTVYFSHIHTKYSNVLPVSTSIHHYLTCSLFQGDGVRDLPCIKVFSSFFFSNLLHVVYSYLILKVQSPLPKRHLIVLTGWMMLGDIVIYFYHIFLPIPTH